MPDFTFKQKLLVCEIRHCVDYGKNYVDESIVLSFLQLDTIKLLFCTQKYDNTLLLDLSDLYVHKYVLSYDKQIILSRMKTQ